MLAVLVASKIARSALPGTLAPEAPPEVADQLAVVFQSPVPTRYRFAASAPCAKNNDEPTATNANTVAASANPFKENCFPIYSALRIKNWIKMIMYSC